MVKSTHSMVYQKILISNFILPTKLYGLNVCLLIHPKLTQVIVYVLLYIVILLLDLLWIITSSFMLTDTTQ